VLGKDLPLTPNDLKTVPDKCACGMVLCDAVALNPFGGVAAELDWLSLLIGIKLCSTENMK